ncbi:hypothetical protein M758_1G195200 [Ceratodon purpureus]|uniref:Uncharacterized protein n=1 Tax=Ceratodon purpureus TaxID=3225 RepID=A0A8T0JBM7_CERPU|nr:hypothetical protein KC19_1G225900 [Ceratodon purpureus]KAG0630667.1 hypothetical protein M758_1G195200 [Ceratodon purpureus]
MGAELDAPITPHTGAAAVTIQKTYRGYRARRKLADAAVMSKSVGVGWWNVVDAVVLREHTLHYFAHSKSWKAHDNWKRLKRKASKLGKGLEKDNKALKLALEHWLEAIDARHRYGHNLRPYYLHWVELETVEPFFYWLDLGAGRQVEVQKCSRATLLDQQIKYLSPDQRIPYEVSIYNGKLFYKLSGELVHTGSTKTDRWIFVMSPAGGFYVGKKIKGVFQHSSFLAGGATTAAGRLVVEHGVLKLMEAHSGHYRPSPENFEGLVQILIASGADLHLAKVQLVSDDLLEKRKAKKLAAEVRAGIQHAGTDGHVAVNVENQKLVTVDSGSTDGLSEYLVTNLTFTEFNDTMATKHAAEDSAVIDEANRLSKEQPINNEATVPEQPINNEATVPEQPTNSEATVPEQPINNEATVPEQPAEEQVPVPAAQEDEHKQPAIVEDTPTLKNPIPRKKPCALVLPSVGAMSNINSNIPRTPTVPTSPGFSRNASLAVLTPQERRQTLKTYGPKKTTFAPSPKKSPLAPPPEK